MRKARKKCSKIGIQIVWLVKGKIDMQRGEQGRQAGCIIQLPFQIFLNLLKIFNLHFAYIICSKTLQTVV